MAVYTDTVLMGMEELNLQPGDTAKHTTILTGGTLNVGAGAVAADTHIIHDGSPDLEWPELVVSGEACRIQADGGTIEVHAGGTVSDAVLNTRALLRVNGGAATGITANAGSMLRLENGGSVDGAAIAEGAIFGWGFHCSASNLSGIAAGMEIKADVSENYHIFNEEIFTVGNGQTSLDAEAARGGKLVVETGGTATGFTAASSADVSYDFGTTVYGTAENGVIIKSTPDSSMNYRVKTEQNVGQRQIAFGGFVQDKAVQNVRSGGETSYMTVEAGGVQNAETGSRVNVSKVHGTLNLASGAVSNYLEVYDGGAVHTQSGAVLNNGTVYKGGVLRLAAGTVLNGTTQVTGSLIAAGAVDASGSVIDFTLANGKFPIDPEEFTGVIVNDITLLQGASFSITIAASGMEAGEYRLAGNAANFTGTVSCHPDANTSPYAVLDLQKNSSFALDGKLYTLALNNADELVLQVRPVTSGDVTLPQQVTDAAVNVYVGQAVNIYWTKVAANSPVTYEVRYAVPGTGFADAETITVEQEWAFIEELANGNYEFQVRAIDSQGQAGAWSETGSFRISDYEAADLAVTMTTELWGHDYLPELYGPPATSQPNDVTGYYYADAEKLNNTQDSLYCWGAASSNILTWSGWAANSPYAFANEDETFEYYIDFWKNEGGLESDGLSWFLNGTGLSGTITVPAEGGNLFPQLDASDYIAVVDVSTETDTLLNLLADYFDAGYGVSYAIYSDAGLAHAITGWGYETDAKGNTYLYYSDSDSDYWSGSDDRRDAVNRLSRTRVTVHDDGRLYFEDYMVFGAYLGSFAAIRQFDKIFLGQHETFDDARKLDFSDGEALRAGNLDGENDDDYYKFNTAFAGRVEISVSMTSDDPLLTGLCISIYDALKNLIYSSVTAALTQSFAFNSIAGGLYYLVVTGNKLVTGNTQLPGLNNYHVEVGIESRNVSRDDDNWTQVLNKTEYTTALPDDQPEVAVESLFGLADETTGEILPNWVGADDKKDMRALQVEASGRYTLQISEVTSTLKLTVYRLVGDKLRQVKSVTVNANTREERRGLFDLLLEGGETYFIQAESNTKQGTEYDVSLSGDVFLQADNDDDFLADVVNNPVYAVTAAPNEAGHLEQLSIFGDNWVGFGDKIDYRVLELSEAGSLNFTVSALDAKASGTFTLYRQLDNGKLQKVFTINANSSGGKFKNDVLLNAGTYFVSFESKSWNNGRNTDYTVTVDGELFVKAVNDDDTAALAASDPAYTVWIGADSATLAPVSLFGDNWVGYNDKADYRVLELSEAGSYHFTVSQLDAKANGAFSLWRKLDNGKLQKVFTINANSSGEKFKNNVLLNAGTYFVSFESRSWNNGRNTDYTVTVDGERFVKAVNADDTAALVAGNPVYTVKTSALGESFGTLAPVSLFGDNWVGYNDKADYRVLELSEAGSYNFTVSQLDAKANGAFSLWRQLDNGKLQKVFTVNANSSGEKFKNNVLLNAGTYFVSFESRSWNNGRNTDYLVTMTGTAFGKADSSDDNWRGAHVVPVDAEAVQDEWVGYSDLRDWGKFEVAEDGTCTLQLTGVTGNFASVSLYRQKFDGRGVEKDPARIASVRCNGGTAELIRDLQAGIYYFAVEAQGDAKKSGTGYNLGIQLDEFGKNKGGMLA